MLSRIVVALTFAAGGTAQALPEGYRQVLITSAWNAKFVVQPVAPVKSGSNIILFANHLLTACAPSSRNHNRKTSTNAPEQQWYLQDGATKIQVANTTLCLDAGTGRSNGSPLTVATCADDRAAQKWVYNADSQIVLDASSGAKLCADLYTGAVRDNTRIVLWQCINGDKNHVWKAQNVTAT
ncbi:hypothetical protein PG997_014887 [Apiospora hydei]|uniref:Ricin B lectin domain-containing protein n=1 Tax=Apiospora hydei TaxID=1337664 RepID=A0ABR1UV30_9PEZI